MLKLLRRLCSTLLRRRSKHSTVLIKTYLKPIDHNPEITDANGSSSCSTAAYSSASVHPRRSVSESDSVVIRVATFNAALFSMAPAVNKTEALTTKFNNVSKPKSILKPPKQKPRNKSKLRVSINLPENEISLLRNVKNRLLSHGENEEANLLHRAVVMSDVMNRGAENEKQGRSRAVADVLRELNVDILALQEVKAEEENKMKPLSELAEALGLNYYVFAESWAPQYGNAVLSRWPIKKSDIQKLLDNSDFRSVLKATIDVPGAGEVNFYCTHLDHLDEEWRMKQINAVIEANNEPHLLAGGLNSFCETDYSTERWTDIVKYYQEMGKPRPKADVLRFLKSKQYVDAKDFAGECEPVVIIAKGQSVQGTCKYGTRMDYLLASSSFPFEFVPGSYSVYSSQGTSDHHIVKADLVKRKNTNYQSHRNSMNTSRRQRQNVVRITDPSSCKRHMGNANQINKSDDFSSR